MKVLDKKMKYNFIIISSVLLLSFLISSCSKLNEPLPASPDITTHKTGILDQGSPDFHGNLVRENNWDLALCQSCHAADYSGGITGASCLTCHTQTNGPEACNTCHGDFQDSTRIAPPEDTHKNITTDSVGVGAHVSHLYENELGHQIECSTCHIVPDKYSDPGHIDTGLPAEITFGNLAVHNIAVNPVYNYPAATCSEVYCHGDWAFLKDSSDYQFIYVDSMIVGNAFSPIWNKVDGTQALCGTCHDLPPQGHQNAGGDPNATTCSGCHIDIVDANGNIIDQTKHINGEKNVFGN